MKSLIIIEVEHGETTDALADVIADIEGNTNATFPEVKVLNWTVKVDLPECFVLME